MRSLKKILPVALLALIVVMVPLHFSQAQAGLLFGLASDSLETGLAWLMNNVVLAVMSVFLAIAGWLLNVSMNLTLSIKEFVDSTPAIYMTWKTIRDIAGMFMIFFLLWASFQMILGRSSKFGQLIKSILVAGVLINFSFFIAGLGIDVSNIVSVQLYNAIAPANSLNGPQSEQALRDGSWRSRMDGGLSDIVMSGLRIQTISDRIKFAKNETAGANAAASSGITGPIKVILTGAIAAVIEFMAAMSFGAAAIAFIIRFVILIFLLAFSPLWYATWMIPQLKEYSSKWSKNYMAMLLFMPVYLLLMYLALNVLSTSPIFDVSASAAATGNWWKDFVVLGVNATLVIVLLNIPLLAAASMANGTIGILKSASERFSGSSVFGTIGKTAGRWSYQGTVGRAASKIADTEMFKDAAARSRIAAVALKGTRSAASGYNATLDKQIKEKTAFADSLGFNQKKMNAAQVALRAAQQNLATVVAAGGSNPTAAQQAAITAAEARVGAAKGAVTNVELERKKNYGGYIAGTPPITGSVRRRSADTLYMFVARKNKVASAKIQLPILEKELAAKKDSLKELRQDIKQLINAMRAAPTPPGPTPAQQADLTRMQAEEINKVSSINTLEAHIDKLKLTK